MSSYFNSGILPVSLLTFFFGPQTAGNLFIKYYILGKYRQLPSARDFLRQVQHGLFRDAEAPEVQSTVIALDAGVVVAGIEQKHITFFDVLS